MKNIFEAWNNWKSEIDEVSIAKNKYPFKAIFILGPAGSGKSFIAKNTGIPADFQVSNPDIRIEEVFPVFGISLKFADSSLDQGSADLELLQQNARAILQNANLGHTGNLVAKGAPIIFDTTGENVDKMKGLMSGLEELGYDISIIVVNVPPEVSVERDQNRKRTVGQIRTTNISSEFQKNVVIGQAFIKFANENKHITVLGDIYPNVFDLKTGQLLPGITPEMLHAYPQFADASPARARAILNDIKEDFINWAQIGIQNPRGKVLHSAMLKLLSATKGKMGQSINDIPVAIANAELASIPELQNASQILGGDTSTLIKKAIGSKKNVLNPTIRGTKKVLQKEDIQQLPNEKQIDRGQMPQIPKEQMSSFIASMRDEGVDVFKRKVPLVSLKPAQAHIDTDKVIKLRSVGFDKLSNEMPIVASKDGYILDGTHRFYALASIDKLADITAYIADLSFDELKNKADTFIGSHKEDVFGNKLAGDY